MLTEILITALVGLGTAEDLPSPPPVDDLGCILCKQCPDPSLLRTDESLPDGTWIEYLATVGCDPGDCDSAFQCENEEEQDAEEQQLAELTSLIDSGEVDALRTFVAAHGDRVEFVPERGVVLFRGGCTDDFVALRTLTSTQTAALAGEPAVTLAFQDRE